MTVVQERETSVEAGPEVTGPRQSVVERVTQILDVFLVGPEVLGLEDVTMLTGLPRSTTFRIMTQLVDLEWLEHDARGYRLGTRALGVGARTRDHGALRSAAAGVLNRLHLATGAVVHLGVLEGGLLYYLDKLGGPVLDSVPSTVGTRVPADTTPMGRAMLATIPPEQVDAFVSTTADRPRRAPVDLEDLHLRMNACRRRGGVDIVRNGGPARRITALGAPVLGRGGLVASVGVSSSDGRLIPETAVPPLMAAARRLTEELGGTTTPSPSRRPRHGRRSLGTAPARAAVT